MFFLLAFWLFLVGALAIAWQAGDRRDRLVVLAISGAAILSVVPHLLFERRLALALVTVIDVGLLVVVVRYALGTNRHWPVWFAGIHATALLFIFVALLVPTDYHAVPERIAGFWAIPALIVMVLGLLADQRRGIVNSVEERQP